MSKRLLHCKTSALLLVILFCAGKSSFAQPFSLDERINPIQLNLIDYKKNDPKAKGKICVADITQTKDTMYFFANGFSIFSPAYFGITGNAGSPEISVSLHKENWLQPNHKGTTNEKNHWEKKFRTEGDIGIMVVPKKIPATYAIVLWVGDEVKLDMPSPFKKNDGSASGSGGSGNFFSKYWMYLLIGLLVLVVAFLLLKMKKQKK